MTFKEIKKELGVKSIRDMLDGVGISEQSLSQIKRNNPKRYEMIKVDIILNHYKVGVRELVELLQGNRMCVHSSSEINGVHSSSGADAGSYPRYFETS